MSDGKRYVAPALESPRRLAEPKGAPEPAAIRWHHVAHVVEAYLQTVIALRIGKLHFAIRALQNRKAAQVSAVSLDLQVVRSLGIRSVQAGSLVFLHTALKVSFRFTGFDAISV